MKLLSKYLCLLVVGGTCYVGIEYLFRGYSHWTMFLVGGLCFICCGLLNEVMPWSMKLRWQMLIGAGIITTIEFITGCVVNLYLGWGVWDYSDTSLNVIGQVCLPYSVLWYFLSGLAIVLDDYLRYWFFKEDEPHYEL